MADIIRRILNYILADAPTPQRVRVPVRDKRHWEDKRNNNKRGSW